MADLTPSPANHGGEPVDRPSPATDRAGPGMNAAGKRWLLALVAVASLLAVAGQAPLPQRLSYHQFADSRSWMGVPNAGDVLTNLAFLLPGVLGLVLLFRTPPAGALWSWRALFAGTALVSLGSGYYHWRPENWTLLWDRLPMGISFMGLFSALLCENVLPERSEAIVLLPLQAAGVGSVLYWYAVDDLRFYLWVQFFPLICIVLIPLLFRARFSRRDLLFAALGLYVLAKVTETHDLEIFRWTGERLSGHSIKHLLAGLAAFLLLAMVRNRHPIPEAT